MSGVKVGVGRIRVWPTKSLVWPIWVWVGSGLIESGSALVGWIGSKVWVVGSKRFRSSNQG